MRDGALPGTLASGSNARAATGGIGRPAASVANRLSILSGFRATDRPASGFQSRYEAQKKAFFLTFLHVEA